MVVIAYYCVSRGTYTLGASVEKKRGKCYLFQVHTDTYLLRAKRNHRSTIVSSCFVCRRWQLNAAMLSRPTDLSALVTLSQNRPEVRAG